MQAQVVAAGTAAGFYGTTEPIEGLARALGIPYPGGLARAPGGQVSDIVASLYATRGGGRGSNRRQARGRA